MTIYVYVNGETAGESGLPEDATTRDLADVLDITPQPGQVPQWTQPLGSKPQPEAFTPFPAWPVSLPDGLHFTANIDGLSVSFTATNTAVVATLNDPLTVTFNSNGPAFAQLRHFGGAPFIFIDLDYQHSLQIVDPGNLSDIGFVATTLNYNAGPTGYQPVTLTAGSVGAAGINEFQDLQTAFNNHLNNPPSSGPTTLTGLTDVSDTPAAAGQVYVMGETTTTPGYNFQVPLGFSNTEFTLPAGATVGITVDGVARTFTFLGATRLAGPNHFPQAQFNADGGTLTGFLDINFTGEGRLNLMADGGANYGTFDSAQVTTPGQWMLDLGYTPPSSISNPAQTTVGVLYPVDVTTLPAVQALTARIEALENGS